MNKITSASNTFIKELVKLHKKQERESKKIFLVEGIDLINSAYKSGNLISVYTTDENFTLPGIEITIVTESIIKKISKMKSFSQHIGVVKMLNVNKVKSNIVIFLDGIQDPGNAGTIIRTASSFGFKDICMSNDCVDLYNQKLIRSTKGAIFNINIVRSCNINDLVKIGYDIIASSLDKSAIELKQLKLNNKVVIVFGSEGSGISKEVIKQTKVFVKIPIVINDSLNVGVAAGIILSEMRQK